MNSESSSKMQGAQSGRSAARRAHRATRPTLVTSQVGNEPEAQNEPVSEEAMEPALPPVGQASESVERKRRPGFFATIGKSQRDVEQKADPQAARMARAMRSKSTEVTQEKRPAREKKAVASGSARTPARPRSGFKMRYIMGMMAYLLIADFLGVWITQWMVANKLEGVVFTIGSFRATRSTLIFLALLVVILIVMARLDLIPRSLRAMSESSTPRNTSTAPRKAPASTFETKTAQPAMKQGVKGAHDDLYQEYRANQRYFQKRDRKR